MKFIRVLKAKQLNEPDIFKALENMVSDSNNWAYDWTDSETILRYFGYEMDDLGYSYEDYKKVTLEQIIKILKQLGIKVIKWNKLDADTKASIVLENLENEEDIREDYDLIAPEQFIAKYKDYSPVSDEDYIFILK